MMKKLFLLLLPVLALASCGDDNGTIIIKSKSPITLTKGQTYQIEADSEAAIRYGSADEFHATVSDNGLVTANYVGSTQIRLKTDDDTKFIDVNVYPTNTTLVEPSTLFDNSLQRNEFLDVYGKNFVSSDNGLTATYDLRDRGMGATEYFVFHFNLATDRGRLVKAEIKLKAGTKLDDVKAFLGERYKPSDNAGMKYQDTLDGGKGTMFVLITEGEDGIMTISYVEV